MIRKKYLKWRCDASAYIQKFSYQMDPVQSLLRFPPTTAANDAIFELFSLNLNFLY